MIAKAGVDLGTRRPELARLDPLIDACFAEFWKPAVCTGTNLDGYTASGTKIHKEHSLHYEDLAEDIRSKSVGGTKTQAVLHALLHARIDAAYPGLYDVLFDGAGTAEAHYHIEASPTLMAQLAAQAKEAVA